MTSTEMDAQNYEGKCALSVSNSSLWKSLWWSKVTEASWLLHEYTIYLDVKEQGRLRLWIIRDGTIP